MRHRFTAITVALTTTVSAGVGLLVTSDALASPHHAAAGARPASSTTESFSLVVGGASNTPDVIATGAFTDGGKDKTGGQKDVLVLQHGNITLNHPNKASKFRQHLNQKTCLATVHGHGRYTLSNGTGAYAGISGHGKYQLTLTAIAKRIKGVCTENAKPVAYQEQITATGPVSLRSAA
jgi:hypothetical protein